MLPLHKIVDHFGWRKYGQWWHNCKLDTWQFPNPQVKMLTDLVPHYRRKASTWRQLKKLGCVWLDGMEWKRNRNGMSDYVPNMRPLVVSKLPQHAKSANQLLKKYVCKTLFFPTLFSLTMTYSIKDTWLMTMINIRK